ncbi:hypothetical protein BOTBODRAFT_32439 [Botryobasidium botryosum FD-172 SS1]|uniref:Uncharacterized protein n=1 Tax=Botryobasidium botryosum (strain FD-172 SS1) TaxID=930990 RepID=A0A067MIX7_BOTB1|nr:hypothetical protein BOTBODRAFT_32439 [Botryobasidium botryosum FD-172 SS1]
MKSRCDLQEEDGGAQCVSSGKHRAIYLDRLETLSQMVPVVLQRNSMETRRDYERNAARAKAVFRQGSLNDHNRSFWS